MKILSADKGPDAVGLMQKEPEIDATLMDIMPPEIDGLNTRAIRALPGGKAMPAVAITATAANGLEEGAVNHSSKPGDREQLLSTLRAWLCR